MKVDLVVVEVGSTLTKVRAFDRLGTSRARFVGAGIALTTVSSGDAMRGVEAAVRELGRTVAEDVSWNRAMGTSSAAGGLRMTVHGLVESMTVRAAREAALGAGAVVKMVTAGPLRKADLDRIAEIDPNIVLLAGGVDYGERDTIIANAEALVSLELTAPVVYCGNVSAADEVQRTFELAGLPVVVTDNVYPRVDHLVVEPVRKVIQRVFEEHITEAPGMEHVCRVLDGPVIPTPGAVLVAAEALREVVGDVMVVDVGGATTDVHSVTEGSPELAARALEPEPLAKRTVEGDLGVWLNASVLVEAEGLADREAEAVVPLPGTDLERSVSARLARRACGLAVDRHAGALLPSFGPGGREERPVGRDLSAVRVIVGTGGALVALPGGGDALAATIGRGPLHPQEGAEIVLDDSYLLSSIGVLSQELPQDAGRLVGKYLTGGGSRT